MSIDQSKTDNPGVKEPKNLSKRIKWLRDYYFKGTERNWNNEFIVWSTGTTWDVQYDEMNYYIVPENYPFFQTFKSSYNQSSQNIKLLKGFWKLSIAERKAWFTKEVMVNYMPIEILPGDLIAGARFNIHTSLCLTKKEARLREKLVSSKNGARASIKWFHNHGYGNAGATSGHLVPGHEMVLKQGWKGIYKDLKNKYDNLSLTQKKGDKAPQLRAMMIAAEMPLELATKYALLCNKLAKSQDDKERKKELEQMYENLNHVSWQPPQNFWQAVQLLWLNHMLIMSDENYPGPGVSFGRIDQYLLPYWEKSIKAGMTREFGKEILKCFWIHTNTAYDAIIKTGYQGITSGYGQLITLSGMGENGQDMTNDLTYAILEVIDEMSPILEPKPNIRIHKNTPEKLFNIIIQMISTSQGAPFLLNFDEKSMAGLMKEAKKSGYSNYINEKNVHNYVPVGCLENTMSGNDRSGTVDNNLNLLKALELTLNNGKDLIQYGDPITGIKDEITQCGPLSGNPENFSSWDDFYKAFKKQIAYIVKKCANLYEKSESIREKFTPTPYLSCLVKGCAEKGLDITKGGPELNFTTINAVTFASTVDSLLAIKYLVYDKKICSINELKQALIDNWEGHDILRARAKFKAPKYGRDDDFADNMARELMDLWTNEVWKYKTKSTNRQFRPGMLSWNYWVGDGYVLCASPDGRAKGQFLSNAICPSSGADINGPTANTNSVGKAIEGKTSEKDADYKNFKNLVSGGASHTMTFNPSILKDQEHKNKFIAFLKGYAENGGTALQINMLDPDMLRDAQKNPQDYRHLLVRITGYNAYFTSIGRELQDEVIARLSHKKI